MYFYWMAKAKGKKLFPLSPTYKGVTNVLPKDDLEPNDTFDLAKNPMPSFTGNIYGYQYINDTNLIIDTDCFVVSVEPKVEYVISFDGIGAMSNGDVQYYIPGETPDYVDLNAAGDPIKLHNYSFSKKDIKFSLRFNKAKLSSTAGILETYVIKFLSTAGI